MKREFPDTKDQLMLLKERVLKLKEKQESVMDSKEYVRGILEMYEHEENLLIDKKEKWKKRSERSISWFLGECLLSPLLLVLIIPLMIKGWGSSIPSSQIFWLNLALYGSCASLLASAHTLINYKKGTEKKQLINSWIAHTFYKKYENQYQNKYQYLHDREQQLDKELQSIVESFNQEYQNYLNIVNAIQQVPFDNWCKEFGITLPSQETETRPKTYYITREMNMTV